MPELIQCRSNGCYMDDPSHIAPSGGSQDRSATYQRTAPHRHSIALAFRSVNEVRADISNPGFAMHRAIRPALADRRSAAGRNPLVAAVAGGNTRDLHRHAESANGFASAGDLLRTLRHP